MTNINISVISKTKFRLTNIFLCKLICFPKCHDKIFYWQSMQWYYHPYPVLNVRFCCHYMSFSKHFNYLIFRESPPISGGIPWISMLFLWLYWPFYLDQVSAQIFYFLIFLTFCLSFRFSAFRASIIKGFFTSSRL